MARSFLFTMGLDDFTKIEIGKVTLFISKNGAVIRAIDMVILKTHKSSGYLAVKVNNKSELVHRLLAKGFIPNPENKPCINHKNGNKLDNRLSNLEWCTYSENNKHAYDIGLKKPWFIDSQRHPSEKAVGQYDLSGNLIKEYNSAKEAKEETGASHICAVCKGTRNKSGGFVWKYINN